MVPAILVTDGDQRAALAAVRALGWAGFRVETCAHEGPSLSGASRHCDREHRVPSPLTAPGEFAESVARLCAERSIDVLLPITDAALLAVLPRRHEFAPTQIPFPAFESYSRISNKEALMATAREVGIRTPSQLALAAPPTGGALELEGLPDFPLVIKPARSVVETAGARRQTGVTHVPNMEAFPSALARYTKEAYPLLLQERISGPGVGVFILIWEGRVMAAFAHRRLREKPPTGGVSVYRESVSMDPQLLDRSRRLLERHDWSGVAMVEFKRSTADGEAYLMEVNGRFWGSLQLAIDAGVDFPTSLVRLTLGEQVSPITSYREGVRSRWFLGDLDHLLLRIRRRYEADELPPGAGGLVRACLRVFAPWAPRRRSEVLRLSDPGPGIRECRQWLERIAR